MPILAHRKTRLESTPSRLPGNSIYAMRTSATVEVLGATIALTLTSVAVAETAPVPDTTITVLKAARIFDATGAAMITATNIVVRGDRILAVSAAGTLSVGARTIDLGDTTLLPGFIDAHTHLTFNSDKDFYRNFFNNEVRFPAEQALYAAMYARHTLEAGFTTVRNLGGSDYVELGLRNAINAGVADGPRMLTAIHVLSSPGGQFDDYPGPPDRKRLLGPVEGICSGTEECRKAVRYQLKWGADIITVAVGGGLFRDDVPELTPEELSAIVSEAHRGNRKVAALAYGDITARLAIAAGVDSIEHGAFLSEDTLRLMKAKGVYLVPTCLAIDWAVKLADTLRPRLAGKAHAAAAAHAKMLKAALRVGVIIALGTDAATYPHGLNAGEFGLLTELGMAPAAALIAGTRTAAALLGVASDVGTLEPGKIADIVGVPGDVLHDIHATEHPVFVMHLGHIVLQPAGQ